MSLSSSQLKKCQSNPAFSTCIDPDNRSIYLKTISSNNSQLYNFNKTISKNKFITPQCTKHSYLNHQDKKISFLKQRYIPGKITKSDYETEYEDEMTGVESRGSKQMKVIRVKDKQYKFNSPQHYQVTNQNIKNKQTQPIQMQSYNNDNKNKQYNDNREMYLRVIRKYQKQNIRLQIENRRLKNEMERKNQQEKIMVGRVHQLMFQVERLKREKQYHQTVQSKSHHENSQPSKKQIIIEEQLNEDQSLFAISKTTNNIHKNDLSVSAFDSMFVPPLSRKEKLQELQEQFERLLKKSFEVKGREKQELRLKLAEITDEMKELRTEMKGRS